MIENIIQVRNLAFSYPDGTRALSGVSFMVRRGESVGVVGENGAGKSTLLLLLAGSLLSQNGEVIMSSTPLTKKTLREVRKKVGMVFQNPDDQLFMPLVRDDVAFGPINMGLAPAEVGRRVRDSLARVNAQNLSNRPPHRLSAGQKRSVAIATVLSMEPEVLVMDEPTSDLDPKGRRSLIDLLKSFGHTKIVASHDLDFILDLCERTIVLHRGLIAADGRTEEIFQNGSLLEESRLERPLRMQGCPLHESRIS